MARGVFIVARVQAARLVEHAIGSGHWRGRVVGLTIPRRKGRGDARTYREPNCSIPSVFSVGLGFGFGQRLAEA